MKTCNCDYFVPVLLLCLGGVWGMPPLVHAGEPQEKAGMISLMTQVPQITPFSDYAGTDWRTATCLGEIGAKRQALYEKGIAIDVGMTNVFQGVESGGVDKKWENTNITDQQISLDSGRLNWWPGGAARAPRPLEAW